MVKLVKEYGELKKENRTLKARIARLEDENARLKYTDGDDDSPASMEDSLE